MLYGEGNVKNMSRYDEKMSYEGIRDLYFTEKKAELMGTGYEILECFRGPLHFSKKLLDSVGLLGNYKSVSLPASITVVYSMFTGEDPLKLGANHTH